MDELYIKVTKKMALKPTIYIITEVFNQAFNWKNIKNYFFSFNTMKLQDSF